MKTVLKVTLIVSVILVGIQFGAVAGIGSICFGAVLLSPVARHGFAAIDTKPSTVFGAGFAFASHAISFNNNDATSNKTLPQLTDAESDPTTGDARAILFAICEQAYQHFKGLAQADRPTKFNITKAVTTSREGVVQNTFTVKFTVNPPSGQFTIPSES